MAATRTGIPDETAQPQSPENAAAPARPDEAPTGSLLLGSVSDRCANCGATMASDQRYCVECGERRGSGRFALTSPAAKPETATSSSSRTSDGRHHFWGSSGATIVAGIATLVLAMGVGVLIGRTGNNNNNTPAKAAAPTVVTVNGGSGTATPAQTSTQTTSTPSSSNQSNSGSSAVKQSPKTEAKKAKQAAAAKAPTKAAVKKASHAAQSVLGGSGGQSNNTVTQGGSCKSGSAGCQGGHFTGNFFGQ